MHEITHCGHRPTWDGVCSHQETEMSIFGYDTEDSLLIVLATLVVGWFVGEAVGLKLFDLYLYVVSHGNHSVIIDAVSCHI